MWLILGQTTLDALRVLDWAITELGAGSEVVAGGVSIRSNGGPFLYVGAGRTNTRLGPVWAPA